MTYFFLGFLTFLLISFIANMFDEDFRLASARVFLGLLTAPFFLFMLLAYDRRVSPTARKLSPATLARVANQNQFLHAWAFAFRKRGILIVRSLPSDKSSA